MSEDNSPALGGGPIDWPVNLGRPHTFAMPEVTEHMRQERARDAEHRRELRRIQLSALGVFPTAYATAAPDAEIERAIAEARAMPESRRPWWSR